MGALKNDAFALTVSLRPDQSHERGRGGGRVAQMVEHRTFNPQVLGSSPSATISGRPAEPPNTGVPATEGVKPGSC